MSYEPFDKATASAQDRVAWALCQIVDDDAPLRWTRYRFAACCIASNPEVMADLCEVRRQHQPQQIHPPRAAVRHKPALEVIDRVFASQPGVEQEVALWDLRDVRPVVAELTELVGRIANGGSYSVNEAKVLLARAQGRSV